MSCRYYFYCPTCGKESGEIGTNNPEDCAKLLKWFYMYTHALHLLDKCLGKDSIYHIECTGLCLYAAKEFFNNHKYCLEQREYMLSNEWGECSPSYQVKSDFGSGGTYPKIER